METKILSLGGEDPVEDGTATLSNILAWEIPWAEPGGMVLGVAKSQSDTAEVTEHARTLSPFLKLLVTLITEAVLYSTDCYIQQ